VENSTNQKSKLVLSAVDWSQSVTNGLPDRFDTVNSCSFLVNFKKQSQFAGGVNWSNVSNSNDLWRFLAFGGSKKTKPISKTEDRRQKTAKSWQMIEHDFKKQSQFAGCQNECKVLYNNGL